MSLRKPTLWMLVFFALPCSIAHAGFGDLSEMVGGDDAEDDNHLYITFDDTCVGPGGFAYTDALYDACCNPGGTPKADAAKDPASPCSKTQMSVMPDIVDRKADGDPTVESAIGAINGYNSNAPITNRKSPPPKEEHKEGSGGPLASSGAANAGGEITGPLGMSTKDKIAGTGDDGAPVARRGGSGSGFGGGSGGGSGGGLNSADIKTGVLSPEQAAATVGQEDPNAKYAGGGAGPGGSGSGSRGPGGFGFGGFGSGGSGAGGPADLAFGAREDGTNAMGSSDPDDYFTRTDLFANIFKVVEKRYRNTATDWAKQDARGITPGAALR